MKPKLTIDQFGYKYWYLNGEVHRIDGPAIIYPDGYKYWYLNNELHRTDGPAFIHPNGTKSWYLNNKKYPQKTWFNILIKMYLK